MRKIKHINYKFGEDTIFTDFCRSKNGWMLTGDVKIDRKYKILLLKINENGEKLWSKTYGDEYEYEAQTIIKARNGYLIGGNAYGKATESGGKGWKAYILSVDKDGEKLRESSYTISGNDTIYSMISKENELWAMGESRDEENYIFIMKLDKELKLLDIKKSEKYEDVLAGGIFQRFLCYSYKYLNKWYGRVIRVDRELEEIWKKEIPNLLIYSATEIGDLLLVVGTKDNMGIAMKIDENGEKEITFKNSTILSAEIQGDLIILAGEYGEKPVIYMLNKNLKMIDKFVNHFTGWYEKAFFISPEKIMALGYSSVKKEAVISILTIT